MKIRMFLLSLLAVCGIATVAAQEKERGVFAEMNFGYGRSRGGYAVLTPAVGYRFAGNWSVGLRLQCEVDRPYTALGAFAQYRFFSRPRFELFAEGQGSLFFANDAEADANPLIPSSDGYAEAGVTFGASYAIVKRLRVQARYLYLGYSGSPAFRRSGACWGDNGMVLDAGWNRLQVGLQYTF
ncbi:MAG: hypothetical protein K2N93_01550 [Alistipes sp.]|nr:hypothetical protein [Alistipes sp.]